MVFFYEIMVILECGYFAFLSNKGKNDLVNNMVENDLVEVDVVYVIIWVLYYRFLFLNVLIG